MIKINNLSKTYQNGNVKTFALKGISLEIEKGEFVAITGRSGCGKSTLINIIASLDKPTKGTLHIDNHNLGDMSEKDLSVYRNEMVGIVFQSYYLEETYTVYKNIQIPLLIKGVKNKDHSDLIMPLLEFVGMEEYRNKKANFLSGGEKQRVCIARAMVCDPEIILADEPCGNLDVENSKTIMHLLSSFSKQGKTVVLVTHNMEDAKLADRIITLEDGKVVSDEKK